MPAGSLVGALAVTALADKIGRKNTIILSSIIWAIGGILQCASIVRTCCWPTGDAFTHLLVPFL